MKFLKRRRQSKEIQLLLKAAGYFHGNVKRQADHLVQQGYTPEEVAYDLVKAGHLSHMLVKP